ncbi:hypothetical protein ETD83_25945 [Actinomadura soli]|uniref:Uncharacterized protein n=1 Tax=Actinomadura soli TaxID=2508997 RepID=A0A5C4J6H4_9ACTN|nr:hypothetical protein [Actinomadura soli]TMQ93096.1 hypothetical protein ETD83_25945 [Actinomadura soli]
MAGLLEISKISVESLGQELHYRVTDSSTGEAVANVSPVAVAEPPQVSVLKRFGKRVVLGQLGGWPHLRRHVPRITVLVTDASNSAVMFLDRADKITGNPYPPQCAVIEPDGRVAGYLTDDHYESPMPTADVVDAEGMAIVGGKHHLRDQTGAAICDVVTRLAMPPLPQELNYDPNVDTTRFVGQDGTVWARRRGQSPLLEISPDTPYPIRRMILASMVADTITHEYQVGAVSPYKPPTPLQAVPDPYPGYADVHSRYMEYQQEFIEWYRKEMTG